jgi:beta-glucanase (GH16 family)
MRAAPGTGIVSSIVLESDDLDEIDWVCLLSASSSINAMLTCRQEWLGGNNTSVETNYFGKGNTTSYDRAIYYPVSTPNDDFHTYAINWTSSSIQWIIDGTTVRTLNYEDAVGGKNFPQTPCKVALGVWAAGTSAQAEGTIEWAGGLTDFTKAPFPMYVQSVTIQNYNPGMNYHWTDLTGDYTSIQVVNATNSNNSTTIASAHKPSSLANPDGVVSGNASTSAAGKGTTSAASASGGAFVQASGAAGLISGSSWVLLFGVAFGFSLL